MEKIATDICSFENLRKSGYVYGVGHDVPIAPKSFSNESFVEI